MIADGFPNSEIDNWNVVHVKLPRSHNDNGNTPRSVGSLLAEAENYDFVAYLDADNWFHSDHLISLLKVFSKTSANVCCSWRTFHRLDGSILEGVGELCERNYTHVDTSCFLLHRPAFRAMCVWHKMPRRLSPVCDRVFYAYLKRQGFSFAYSNLTSVAFRSQYESHYLALGEQPPPGLKTVAFLTEAYQYLTSPDGVAESVDTLGFWPLSEKGFLPNMASNREIRERRRELSGN
jgi:hypothetical protein